MLQSIFPKTIRGKIMLYTAAVTCSIAVFTVTICSFVFQSFLRKNQIQTSEYSLEVICNGTAADLENILSFYKWCSFNTDIAAYLDGFENLSQMPSISSKKFRPAQCSASYLRPSEGRVLQYSFFLLHKPGYHISLKQLQLYADF